MSGSWDGEPNTGPTGGGWDTANAPAVRPSSGTGPGAPTPITVSGAPIYWLLLGIATAAGGLAIPLLTKSHPLAIVGWLLGGTVSILLMAAFTHFDLKRRGEGFSRDSALAPWLRRLLLSLAAVAVALNAWTIADAAARSSW